jgi:hypothetical protein
MWLVSLRETLLIFAAFDFHSKISGRTSNYPAIKPGRRLKVLIQAILIIFVFLVVIVIVILGVILGVILVLEIIENIVALIHTVFILFFFDTVELFIVEGVALLGGVIHSYASGGERYCKCPEPSTWSGR